MPRSYPAEFRRKVLDLIEAGRPVAEIADQLGVTGQTIYNWRNQDLVDRGLRPGVSTAESVELAAARKRIREPSTSTYAHSNKQMLLRPVESAQFTSWAFIQRARDAGLAVSMGSIGDCFDNAVIEAFWARMQVELLNRRRWRTRLELSNAIFEYLEIFS